MWCGTCCRMAIMASRRLAATPTSARRATSCRCKVRPTCIAAHEARAPAAYRPPARHARLLARSRRFLRRLPHYARAPGLRGDQRSHRRHQLDSIAFRFVLAGDTGGGGPASEESPRPHHFKARHQPRHDHCSAIHPALVLPVVAHVRGARGMHDVAGWVHSPLATAHIAGTPCGTRTGCRWAWNRW